MKGGERAAAALALLACSLLLSTSLVPPLAGQVSSSTTSSPPATSSLAVSVVPPELPADGGTYPAVVVSLLNSSGAASIAVNGTSVFITSTQAGVGTVSDQVTIPPGVGFAVANFTTTTTPGTTTVSATSAGLGSSSVKVTTVAPSGVATRLDLIPVPNSTLVGAAGPGTLIVETLDAAGLPAKVTSDLSVTLYSSDPGAVSLPSGSLVVQYGSFLASTEYDAGLAPGVATIQASASDFASGSATVTVQGLSASALQIFAQPAPLPASTAGRLVVTLTDSQGDPVPAPEPIPIAISSSNTSLVSADQSVTIPEGQVFAVASISSGAAPGTVNLTASSPGLMSDFAPVSVVVPTLPTELELTVAPDPMLADDGQYTSVLVGLTDSSGDPALATSAVTVTLTSSNSAVGQVSGSVTISPGDSYAVATFSSTFSPGSTFITALAQNLQSATATAETYGSAPTKLALQTLFPDLPADGGNYSALLVALEGSSSGPAVAAADTVVLLDSSSDGVAVVSPAVTIAAGQSYAIGYVVTTLSAGTVDIDANTTGLASTTQIVTSSPVPSQLGAYLAPADSLQGLSGAGAILAVQLQGAASYPATALVNTVVSVSSSNTSVVSPFKMEVPAGADYAWALVNSSTAGTSVLTASADGLGTASATLTEAAIPVMVSLTSSVPNVSIGGAATVTLLLQVLGTAVAGAEVTITATSGSMSPSSGTTDSAGQFTGTFIPSQDGVALVTASVQDALVGNRSSSINILVTPQGAGGGTSRGGLPLLDVLPLVIVVVAVLAIAFVVRRTIKKRKALAEDAEASDQSA